MRFLHQSRLVGPIQHDQHVYTKANELKHISNKHIGTKI